MIDTITITDIVCRRLATHNIATYTPPGGRRLGTGAPIAVKYFPDQPDTAILITVRPIRRAPHANQPVTTWQIQVRTRSPSLIDVERLADQISQCLTSEAQWPPGVRRAFFTTSIPLGRDAKGRDERSDNYEIHTYTTTI